MKRSTLLSFFAVFVLIFSTGIVFSQTVSQKLITVIPPANGSTDAYSLKYDAKTGSWVYASYDTITTKYTIISPKGTSKQFNYAMTYNALFDADGNSYMYASENITDTVYKYSVLKNNEVIAEYEMVLDGWVIKDNIIYYAAKDAGKYYVITYDTRTGTSQKSKTYDEVRFAYIPEGGYSEGEPVGYAGFTASGKLYYIATQGDETFLVIGDQEQKHYSDISWYDMKFNAQDEPCYVAKSQGKFYYERGNTFLVKGTTEYKSFDWVYGPIVFDNSGNPLYTGQDSAGEYRYRSNLMKGNDVIASVTGSIYNYSYTADGKLTYILSEEKPAPNGESTYSSSLVIDGKKGASYTSVNNPLFGKNGNVLFVASDKNNKYFVVHNNEVISGKYDYISEAKFMPNGKVAYIGVKYGNYEKKIADKSYVVVDDEEFGPYNLINTADWKTNEIILSDNKGNFAFMAGDIIDMAAYTYKYMAVTNKGEGKKFDNMSDMRYVNNKLFYFAGNTKEKDSYIYDYSLYADNKKLGDTYSAYTDLNVSASGIMTFIGSKGNDMYYVEVKP